MSQTDRAVRALTHAMIDGKKKAAKRFAARARRRIGKALVREASR